MKWIPVKCLASLVFYAFQLACIVTCVGDPPTFGAGWAVAAFFLSLGSTFVIATFGPSFEFLWILNPLEEWRR